MCSLLTELCNTDTKPGAEIILYSIHNVNGSQYQREPLRGARYPPLSTEGEAATYIHTLCVHGSWGNRCCAILHNLTSKDLFMKPIVLGMLICDYYYRDTHSGKSIISGTFSSINVVSFPSKHGNCAVYIALTDVAKSATLQLVFKKEDSDFSMEMPEWEVQCPENRRAVVEIGGNINGLPLPEEGFYEFVVYWDKEELFSRRLRALKVDKNDELPDNPEAANN